jgi:hypothetical protein
MNRISLDKILTDKEEWELHNGGIRISLEALKNKKKPQGSLKKCYSEINNSFPGPYYDTYNSHLHIWKKGTQINNFMCEQNQKNKHVEYMESDINNVYCSICHAKKNNNSIKQKINSIKTNNKLIEINNKQLKSNISDKWFRLIYKYFWKCELQNTSTKQIHTPIHPPIHPPTQKQNNLYIKWYKITYKLLYKPILYNICPTMTIFKYPWELTYYQEFKLKNPNYKQNCIFINPYSKFYYDYLVIE